MNRSNWHNLKSVRDFAHGVARKARRRGKLQHLRETDMSDRIFLEPVPKHRFEEVKEKTWMQRFADTVKRSVKFVARGGR